METSSTQYVEYTDTFCVGTYQLLLRNKPKLWNRNTVNLTIDPVENWSSVITRERNKIDYAAVYFKNAKLLFLLQRYLTISTIEV